MPKTNPEKQRSMPPRNLPAKLVIAGVVALLFVLSGLVVNSTLGTSGTATLHVGESATLVTSGSGTSQHLPFALLLQRRIDELGPVSARISVRNLTSGLPYGFIDLREGDSEVQFQNNKLWLNLERFNPETGKLYFRGHTDGERLDFLFQLERNRVNRVDIGQYALILDAYKIPTESRSVHSKIALIEGKDIAVETWLYPGTKIKWNGFHLMQTGWGKDSFGRPVVAVMVEKTPGTLLLWLAPFSFFIVLALTHRKKPSTRQAKHAAFTVITVFLALGLIELGCRGLEVIRDRLLSDNNPYIDLKDPEPLFELATENGVSIYRRTTHHLLVPDNKVFLGEKPTNGYRVFLIGGSAAVGWPFEYGEYNIGNFLQRKLERLLPQNKVEVVTVAGGTYGSHRVKAIFDEIINYQPDLILIYSGNNEFLENFAYRRQLPEAPWKYSAIARLTFDIYSNLTSFKPQFDQESYSIADQTSNRIAFAFGKVSQYRKNPDQFRQLQEHYRYNIDSMIQDCIDRKVDVLLLNVPVNLKDWVPNSSIHRAGLPPEDFTRWQQAFRDGMLALEGGRYPEAITALQTAVHIDDEHAESHYLLGRALLTTGHIDEARKEFTRALERDAYPFRALPRFQEILSDIATSHQIPLVDIISALEQESKNGIIGLDVLLDYVHATEQHQETIAQAIVRSLSDNQLFPSTAACQVEDVRMKIPPGFRPQTAAEAAEAVYTQFLIMRQYDKMEDLYRNYRSTMKRAMQEDPSLTAFCQRGLEISRIMQPIIRDYADLLHAEKIGLLEQEYSQEDAERIYQKYVNMIRQLEAPGMTREAFLQQVPDLDY